MVVGSGRMAGVRRASRGAGAGRATGRRAVLTRGAVRASRVVLARWPRLAVGRCGRTPAAARLGRAGSGRAAGSGGGTGPYLTPGGHVVGRQCLDLDVQAELAGQHPLQVSVATAAGESLDVTVPGELEGEDVVLQ